MLTITDLTVRHDLDTTAMSHVRGGSSLSDFDALGIFNTPQIDLGTHLLAQGQSIGVDQSFNIGGLNLVIADQDQHAISGQVA